MFAVLHHLFLPHHTNNHRARVLHVDALLFYVLAFAAFRVGLQWFHESFPDVLGYATDINVSRLLEDSNTKRQAAGLGTLQLNGELSQAASAKAQDMFAKNYWAHFSPDGKTPWDFIVSSGYHYAVAGENLAKNFSTSDAVVEAWMNSPTHRDNLLKSQYNDVGFAVVNGRLNGEETTLVVQMFGSTTRVIASAPPQTTPQVTVIPTVIPTSAITKTQTVPIKTTQVAIKPVEVSVAAVSNNTPTETNFPTEFFSAISRPLIDIPLATKRIAYIFTGILLGVLVVDAWVVARRKIVRVTGHNLGHFVFLVGMLIAMNTIVRGSIL